MMIFNFETIKNNNNSKFVRLKQNDITLGIKIPWWNYLLP